MKKLSLVLLVLSTLALTACGSSGSSGNNNSAANCGTVNQTYPYQQTNCNGLPAGYTYVNGQLVYTGAGTGVGYAGVGYTGNQYGGGAYGSNPCLVYGPTWFPSNGMCMSYY